MDLHDQAPLQHPEAEAYHIQESIEETNSIEVLESIWDPLEKDVLSGRGAKVNARLGNKKFRALCFSRKPEFDAGNHAAKRRIATEIVLTCKQTNNSRFLKKTSEDAPWFEMSMEASIAKACQVMRDYKRPDRELAQQARKRERRVDSTPMDGVPTMQPVAPFVENPFGVHDHDILSGRGAFVNGHVGNQRLRSMAMERKIAFDAGNFTEKQALASEIVAHIRNLDPPGRFLKKTSNANQDGLKGLSGEWEELTEQQAIHKACQVMRDINRPDRMDREAKKRQRKNDATVPGSLNDIQVAAEMIGIAEETATEALKHANVAPVEQLQDAKRELANLEETMDESETVQETVAAAEAALDRALETTFV